MRIIFLCTIIISAFTFNSCQKGDTGPAGKDGKDGSINISSTTYNINSWTSGSSYWYTNLSVTAITSANLNTVGVQVFFSTNNGTDWAALPYTQVASTNYFFNYITSAGMVEPQWVYNGVGIGSNPNSYYGVTLQIKVVVIPAIIKKSGINHNNYNELKKAYNLKD